jgi:hypothetical protein
MGEQTQKSRILRRVGRFCVCSPQRVRRAGHRGLVDLVLNVLPLARDYASEVLVEVTCEGARKSDRYCVADLLGNTDFCTAPEEFFREVLQ